jgi:hypothetical protein
VAILAAGWMVLILYAFPGVMTMDSFDQLREGRTWFFTDAHPPAMAALWGVLDRVVRGPLLMLLVQSAAFLGGLFLMLTHAMSRRRAAVAAVVLLLFPPVLVPMAVIWKDCLMAGFFVLGIAGLLHHERRWRLWGLALLSLATAMRYNAPAATLPLIFLLFYWRAGMHWLARYTLALGAWIVVTVVAMAGNSLLVAQEMHFWHSSLALEDIVGTLAHVSPELPDSELGPLLAPTGILADHGYHARLVQQYVPYDFQQLVSGEGHLWDVPIAGTQPAPPAQREAIERAWKAIVPAHPAAYLAYRVDVFAEVLGVHKKFQGATVIRHEVQYRGMLDTMHLPLTQSGFSRTGEDFTMWTAKRTRLFRPHVYVILALALLGFCLRQRAIGAILLSGLGLEVSLFPLVQAPDYRYSHWLVTCTLLALVMLVARRARVIGAPGSRP